MSPNNKSTPFSVYYYWSALASKTDDYFVRFNNLRLTLVYVRGDDAYFYVTPGLIHKENGSSKSISFSSRPIFRTALGKLITVNSDGDSQGQACDHIVRVNLATGYYEHDAIRGCKFLRPVIHEFLSIHNDVEVSEDIRVPTCMLSLPAATRQAFAGSATQGMHFRPGVPAQSLESLAQNSGDGRFAVPFDMLYGSGLIVASDDRLMQFEKFPDGELLFEQDWYRIDLRDIDTLPARYADKH